MDRNDSRSHTGKSEQASDNPLRELDRQGVPPEKNDWAGMEAVNEKTANGAEERRVPAGSHGLNVTPRQLLHTLLISMFIAALVWFTGEFVKNSLPGSIASVFADITMQKLYPYSDKSCVVLFGDAQQQDWPLPYSSYENFLVRSWCLGATSVFIDIAFLKERNGSPDLAGLNHLRETIADLSGDNPHAEDLYSQYCELPGIDTSFKRSPMHIFVAEPNYPEASEQLSKYTASPESDGREYYKAYGGSQSQPTAAYAIRNKLCREGRIGADICKDELLDKFIIRDRMFTPAEQSRFSRPSSSGSEVQCFYYPNKGPLHWPWRMLLRQGFWVPLEGAWSLCPPVLTLTWDQFFSAINIADVFTAVRGKMLFLGSAIPNLSDRIDTVFHPALPGVYMHALATEQMISYSARHSKPAPMINRFLTLTLAAFVTLIAALALQSIRTRHVDRIRNEPESRKLLLVAPVSVGVLIICCMYYQYNWSPNVIIQDSLLFFLCYTEHEMEILPYIAKAVKRRINMLLVNDSHSS